MENKTKKSKVKVFGEVVDLFCGVGALSFGLKQSGLKLLPATIWMKDVGMHMKRITKQNFMPEMFQSFPQVK